MVKLRKEAVDCVNAKMVPLKRELDLLGLSLNHFNNLYGKETFLGLSNFCFVYEPDVRVFKNNLNISISSLEYQLTVIQSHIDRIKKFSMDM